MVKYATTLASTFLDRVRPRDVKAALTLLSYLYLKNDHVVKSTLTNSLMLLIKESSAGMDVHLTPLEKLTSCLLGS